MKEITEEMFKAAQTKYSPNGWTRLAYRYFSTDTKPEDKDVRKVLVGTLFILFVLGFGCTILSIANLLIVFVTISYLFGLVALGIFMLAAFIMNRLRIKKICKALGISQSTYNDLNYYWSDVST